ncbi:MAG: caspase family protein [Geminicoccaceae bacterium]
MLIGNEAYTDLPVLRNPINDIQSFADSLRELGFKVVEEENLTDATALNTAVQAFATAAKAAGAEAVLVHYAGHGFQIDGVNYLMPTGIAKAEEPALEAELNRQTGGLPLEDVQRQKRLSRLRLEHARSQSLPLDNVLATVELAADTRILMFDACRNLPTMRAAGQEPEVAIASTGFASARGDAGTLIVFATQPGEVAADGGGNQSPFMQAMLDHIGERGLGIDELLTRVRRDVHEVTRGKQTPWAHSALLEPFSFDPVPPGYHGETPLVQRPADPIQVAEADQDHWRMVENSFDPDAYRSYLDAFPKGAFVGEAKELMRRLGTPYVETKTAAAITPAAGPTMEVAEVGGRSRNAAVEAPSGPRRIAVLGETDFVADRLVASGSLDQPVGLPDALVDQIAAMLARSPRFDMVERHELRQVISEQRVARPLGETYLERTFEDSFGDVRPNGGDVVLIPDGRPVDGSGIVFGSGLGASAGTGDYLDLLKDFKDLGSSVGADFLVFGRLEPVAHKVHSRQIPYTQRRQVDETMNARLRMRVVDVKEARIIAAFSLESEVEVNVFRDSAYDARSAIFDRLARDVTGAIADSFHQASIVRTEPMVVDRGAIHGVRPGDSFTIQRARPNELVSQDGTELGDHKIKVATVRATVVEDLWSEVELIEGDQPAQYDSARLDRDAATKPFLAENSAPARQAPRALKPNGEPEEGLPRLAVLPVRFTPAARRSRLIAHTWDRGADEPFAQGIAAALHQSRRFLMLERYQVERFIDEADLGALDGQGRLPEDLLNLDIADHLVMTEISLLDYQEPGPSSGLLRQEGPPPPAEGEGDAAAQAKGTDSLSALRSGRARGFLEGVIRVADARTGAWLEARRISISINLKPGLGPERVLAELAKEFSAKAGLELVNAVFPLKVAAVSEDGTVYVNRGLDGGLEVGEVLTGFRQGPEIVDPDTGISLGREETMVGQVTLTRVDDFTSVGTIANLSQPFGKSDRLRRQTWNRGKTAGGSQISGLGSAGGVGDEGEAVKAGQGQRVLALRSVDVARSGKFDLAPVDLVPRLHQDLASRLQASRRYVIVERAEVNAVFEEAKLNSSIDGSFSLPESLRAVDYAVLTRLDNLFVKTEREHNAVLDETSVTKRAVVEAQIRLIDVRSFEQVAAETIRFERQLAEGSDQRLLLGDMLAALADGMVEQIMNVTFPVEVIGGRDRRWYVNRGADGGVTLGDAFLVVHRGEELKDASGISFGHAETEVGRAVVVQVDAARALVEMQGDTTDVSVGDILRPYDERPVMPAAGPETPKVRKPQW